MERNRKRGGQHSRTDYAIKRWRTFEKEIKDSIKYYRAYCHSKLSRTVLVQAFWLGRQDTQQTR